MTSVLTQFLFSTPAMTAAFGDAARLQAMLDAEAALARAQAAVGLIPPSAVAPIEAACHAALYDLEELGRATAVAGNPAIPLVRALILQVEARDAEAALWVHHGATSQDIIDTGMMLQARAGLVLISADLDRAEAALAGHASTHADTVMISRTLLQHALPDHVRP